jgi:hypothetical protein
MNDQRNTMKSASPIGEGERIEVRGVIESAESDNPHPTLSLEKGEATRNANADESSMNS